MAKAHSRKELEKQLERTRKDYNDARMSHEHANNELTRLQTILDAAHTKMTNAKNTLSDLNTHIHIMDLTGASGMKDRSDCKTYIINDKEFKADTMDSNDVKMIPYKDYKASLTPKIEDTLELSESDDIAVAYVEALKLISQA